MNSLHHLSPTSHLPPKAIAALVSGKVTLPSLSYRVRLEWDGHTLKGRLGGAVFGEEVLLEFTQHEVLGWVSGTRVFSLHGRLDGNHLEIQLVGAGEFKKAWVNLGSDTASASLHGESQTVNADLHYSQTHLEGRFGGSKSQHSLHLSSHDTPIWVVVVVALVAEIASRNTQKVLLESYRGLAEC